MGPVDQKLLDHLRWGAEVCKKRRGQFDTFERFVFEHGRQYNSQALTKEEAEIADLAIRRGRYWLGGGFEWRRCFANSQRLLEEDETGKIVYVEGFAYTEGLRPVLHGWVSIHGKVIDVTLPPRNLQEAALREPLQVLGDFTERAYFGVPFLRAYVKRRSAVAGGFGSLLDDEEWGYPLLAAGPNGAVRRRREVVGAAVAQKAAPRLQKAPV